MTVLVVLLLAAAWLAIGWLPSRMVKHYFVSEYGSTLGEEVAWGRRCEIEVAVMALGGPASLMGSLLFLRDQKRPLGWRW